MSYVDGFVVPVPLDKIEAYKAHARKAGEIWKEYGALAFVECIGDDVPHGTLTSFPRAEQATDDEVIIFSWIVYRGKASAVTFTPDQMKTWTDTRAYANSPWSPPYFIPEPPPENKWITQVRFSEPGDYVLRAVASDGAVFTYDNVTVTVTR